jgi:hypothetical protein
MKAVRKGLFIGLAFGFLHWLGLYEELSCLCRGSMRPFRPR